MEEARLRWLGRELDAFFLQEVARGRRRDGELHGGRDNLGRRPEAALDGLVPRALAKEVRKDPRLPGGGGGPRLPRLPE